MAQPASSLFDEEAMKAVALSTLLQMSPARLKALLDGSTPAAAFARLVDGAPPPAGLVSLLGPDVHKVLGFWRRCVADMSLDALRKQYQRAQVSVVHGPDAMPAKLIDDEWAPPVLFFKGSLDALAAPTVGMVGTRRCSAEGRANARRIGAELAEAGVCVVSGLALGVDGASHEGALSVSGGAAPVGVAGSGLGVVYPRRHVDLWEAVAAKGALLSEAPLLAPPEQWRFPARNRIIAGLSDVLVVVESSERGGSLITVSEAQKRNVPVMAVPGSIRSRSSVGTNVLIRDGAAPVLGTEDILMELSLTTRAVTSNEAPGPPPADAAVLAHVDRTPTSTDEIMARTGMLLSHLALSLQRLHQGGWVEGIDGWWTRVDDETVRGRFP